MTDAKIAASEAALIAKYGDKIVVGSVRRAPSGSKYGNKMLVKINTVGIDGKPDGNTVEVATSDVFQVRHTDEVRAAIAKQKAADKRAAAKKTKTTPTKAKVSKTAKPAKKTPVKRTRKAKATA